MDNSVKRAVFFDMDGVLVDSPPVHVSAWKTVLNEKGIDIDPHRLHLEEGRKAHDVARDILNDFGVTFDQTTLEQLVSKKRELYKSDAPKGLKPDAVAAIKTLKESGWGVGMVSGSALSSIEAVLSTTELSMFDVIISSQDCLHAKPHPEPFLTGCRLIGIKPANGIVVENAPLGIQSAKDAGLYVIALTTTLSSTELQNADMIIDDLWGLPELIKKHIRGIKE